MTTYEALQYALDDIKQWIAPVSSGDVNATEQLLQSGADINQGLGRHGYTEVTPLHLAVLLEQPAIVKLLLLRGAKKNVYSQLGIVGISDEYMGTPLHSATWLENVEIMRLLLRAGADLEAGAGLADRGGTPLEIASRHGLLKAIATLIEGGATVHSERSCNHDTSYRTCPAGQAAIFGQLEALKLLERAGEPLRARYADPSLLLAFAATAGQPEIVEYLIARGVPLDCGSDNHPCESPLRHALVEYENRSYDPAKSPRVLKAIELLLRAGANPNVDGLLSMAVERNDTDTLKLLLRAGADPNQPYGESTPLAIALRMDEDRAADLLRAFGATR